MTLCIRASVTPKERVPTAFLPKKLAKTEVAEVFRNR